MTEPMPLRVEPDKPGLSPKVSALRMLTRGAYDLQKLRIQTGLRLYANFRKRLGVNPTEKTEEGDEAATILEQLKGSYKTLTAAVARNRTLPDKAKFTGDGIISDFSELVMVNQYLELERQEAKQFRQLVPLLDDLPIYSKYLKNEIGIGPAMAAVLVTYLNPYKTVRPSQFWAYAGLDVAPDGAARSRRKEHLVDREYIDKDGKTQTKKSVTYNPWFHDRLLGAMAVSVLRAGSKRRRDYDNYKHRIQTDPNRIKMTEADKSKLRKGKITLSETQNRNLFDILRNNGIPNHEFATIAEGPASKELLQKIWTPGRIHLASMRYMMKQFLVDFWIEWRKIEGLPWVNTYAEDKLGLVHHGFRQSVDGVKESATT